MSNATVVHMHHKLLISSQNKLILHEKNCPICSDVNTCENHAYLLGEMYAAMGVYQDSIKRWLARAPKANEGLPEISPVDDIPECPHGCQN